MVKTWLGTTGALSVPTSRLACFLSSPYTGAVTAFGPGQQAVECGRQKEGRQIRLLDQMLSRRDTQLSEGDSMNQERLNERLSRISTQWTMVFQAHEGPADAVARAQQQLLERYSGAAYRYLLGAVRDPDVAT